MIEEIRIKNYLSFHEEQVLSFVASKKKSNKFDEYYCIAPDPAKPDHKLLRMILLYGANASGKSNTLQALQLIRQIIARTDHKKKPSHYKPFLGAQKTLTEPVSIAITFWLMDKKFAYRVELMDGFISFEELVYFPKGRKKRIYKRTYDPITKVSTLKFSESYKSNISAAETEALYTYLIPSVSVIAASSKVNTKNKTLQNIYEYFSDSFNPLLPSQSRLSVTIKNLSKFINNDLFIDFIRKADFNINALSIEEMIFNVDDFKEFPEIVRKDLKKQGGEIKSKFLNITHSNDHRSYNLTLNDESDGTNRWMVLSYIFFMMLTKEQFSIIDEIESSLHPDLVAHFLTTFLRNKSDDYKSQIIATTHNINLLNADFIRRDAVWFTERKEDGSTELFCADDFGLHKNLSLFNAYRTGKLGAVPFVEPFWMEQK